MINETDQDWQNYMEVIQEEKRKNNKLRQPYKKGGHKRCESERKRRKNV